MLYNSENDTFMSVNSYEKFHNQIRRFRYREYKNTIFAVVKWNIESF